MFRKYLFLCRVLSVVLTCLMINPMFVGYTFASNNSAIAESVHKETQWVPGQLLVKFHSELSKEEIDSFIASKGCVTLHVVERMAIYKLELPPSINVKEGIELFSRDRRVVFAEPNYIYSVHRLSKTSNNKYRIHSTHPKYWLKNITPILMLDWMESWIWRPLLKWPRSSRYFPKKFNRPALSNKRTNMINSQIMTEEGPNGLSTITTLKNSVDKNTLPLTNTTSIRGDSVEPEFMDVFFSPFVPISLPRMPIFPRLLPVIRVPPYFPSPIRVRPMPRIRQPRYIPPPARITPLPLLPPIIRPLPPLRPILPPTVPLPPITNPLPPINPPIVPLPPVSPPILPPLPPTVPLPLPPPPIPPPLPPIPITPSIDPVLTPEMYLDMINASSLASGSDTTVIAVVDTGLDTDHPSLSPYLWKNTDEIPGNGIDDDNNGYIDDFIGWDFYEEDNSPEDTLGHGTHVAGIARTVGGSNVKIMAVRAGKGPSLETIDIAEAILYAVDNGADVINLSLGSQNPSQVISEAIKYAKDHGVVIIAAAGNYNTQALVYPATYDGVIAVAALDSFYKKASFSSYGSWVDLSAPGVKILSTSLNGTFTTASGTSMAAPMAAGLAARILSVNSTLSPNQVINIMITTANSVDDKNLGYEGLLGKGILDAKEAVEVAETGAPQTTNNTFNEPNSIGAESLKTEEATNNEESSSQEQDTQREDEEKNEDGDNQEETVNEATSSDSEILKAQDGPDEESEVGTNTEKEPRQLFSVKKESRQSAFDPQVIEVINFKHELAFSSENVLPPNVNLQPYHPKQRPNGPMCLE